MFATKGNRRDAIAPAQKKDYLARGFDVHDDDGKLVGFRFYSDGNGRADISGLPAGFYAVYEVNIPPGYESVTPNPQQIEIVAGQTTALHWENRMQLPPEPQTGRINIVKTNAHA